jgi:hypothetical protein
MTSFWPTSKSVRPFVTTFVIITYNAVLIAALVLGVLPIRDYIMAVGPINASIIAWWFAERAALTDPKLGKQE